MKQVHVIITLKSGVLDPQGRATQNALHHLGFSDVSSVRQGKLIELEVGDNVTQSDVESMCESLLANTVIESYRVEMKQAA